MKDKKNQKKNIKSKDASPWLLEPFAAAKVSESANDIREELAIEKSREGKPLSTLKKVLIGIVIFLVLAFPMLFKALFTLWGIY